MRMQIESFIKGMMLVSVMMAGINFAFPGAARCTELPVDGASRESGCNCAKANRELFETFYEPASRRRSRLFIRPERRRLAGFSHRLIAESGSSRTLEHASQLLVVPKVEAPPIYLNPDAGLESRLTDLLSRMSVAEKIGQLVNAAPGIKRLGLPEYNYWNECLHGVARAGHATVFPQAIGMAATWDTPLVREVAGVIATEARAKYHEAVRHNKHAIYYGLNFWTPNINIFRDPRWGRGQETYGEDPFLCSRLAVAFITGLQGDDPHYLKALACAKHFAVHSGPESSRHVFDARPPEQDLYDTYLPQFEAAVREAKVGSVMGAYNRLYGEPCCASKLLLGELLRGKWGFAGHVVSDCDAVSDICNTHKSAAGPQEAAAVALKTGCDLNCGNTYSSLAQAFSSGLVKEADLDLALARVLRARFQLGMFDPLERQPFAAIPFSECDSPAHSQLSLKAARESVVLLKNDGVLPLDLGKLKRIAVLGANADSVSVLLGNYNGDPSHPVTILQGIRKAAGKDILVEYAQGCPLVLEAGVRASDRKEWRKALEVVERADLVIYVGGLSPSLEGEEMAVKADGFAGGDRTKIELPAVQSDLLKALSWFEKPVVFVNCSGSAVAMSWESENLPAILQVWYPGQEGGTAVADLLFGKISPSGRLPVTFYRSTADLPGFEDYSMKARGYRFFQGKPLWAFGHGLSYTKFRYENLSAGGIEIARDGTINVSCDLTNEGVRDGDEVVQLYMTRTGGGEGNPVRDLRAFKRVHLPAGKSERVTMTVPVSSLRRWDCSKHDYVVEPGAYNLEIGAASDDIRLTTSIKVLD
jgi:beta-glucosidase